MRKLWLIASLIALLLCTGQASAEDVIEGEIIDLACYLPKGAQGSAHARCAQTCAEHGMPLGLLTDDQKIYVLYPKHGKEASFDAVKQLAGKRAKLTGAASERLGLRGFEVLESAAVP